jgi:glucan 1,3-beta-glucosidase
MVKLCKTALACSILVSVASSASIVGTNIGGWQVLEPWITPSLFYRFLGKTATEGVGMDSWTMCEALGPVEGNKLMRAHWDSWLTEDHLEGLAERGVQMVRLPIGDWTLRQYGPYVGCMDGAADKIQWFLDTCQKHGLKVLIDVHCVKDSQNGFDNGGQARDVTWSDDSHFVHNGAAYWMGDWNGTAYTSINHANIEFAVDTVRMLLERWGDHPAITALEPVNEPWWNSDMAVLKDFYRTVRTMMQEMAPKMTFVFHDAFQFSAELWNDLFEDTENVVLDTHFYTAWWGANEQISAYCDGYNSGLAEAKNIKYDVWVGEWSLATDVCAMWLGGLNDQPSPYVFHCSIAPCPYSYLPAPYNVDFDRSAAMLGPYGGTPQTVQYGNCSSDSAYFSDADVNTLGHCALDAFNGLVQAHFMWTFRNEIEPKWSYVQAYDKGWINPAAPAATTSEI